MISFLLASQAADVTSVLANGWTPAAVATLLLGAVMVLGKRLLGQMQEAIDYRDKRLHEDNDRHLKIKSALIVELGKNNESMMQLANAVAELNEEIERSGLRPRGR